MESLARLVVIMVLTLLAVGPLALLLSFIDGVPFFVVLIFAILSISIGIYWITIPTAARWMGFIPICLGIWSIYRELNL